MCNISRHPKGEKSLGLRLERPVVWSDEPPFPHNMLVELTNCCNQKCAFCGYKNMKRRKRACDKELMFDLMRQAYGNGTKEIGFYMIGEPLMCGDLSEYIEKAHKLGFEYIYLTTNGVLADLERMKALLSAGLNSIKFSVNGATRETYMAVHGKDDFEKIKENIKALRDYILKKDIDLPIFLSFVRNELNKGDLDALYETFDNIVDQIYVFDCANQAGAMSELIADGVVAAGELQPGSKAPCEMVFNRIHITCEGYLNACCSDVNGYLSAVDLHKVTLIEAWNSPIMIDLRRRHLRNELGKLLCNNCINNIDRPVVPLNESLLSW